MGIYLHIPFCKQKCSYCDFHFSTTFQSYRKEMIEKMIDEIEIRKNYIPSAIETIYFGGGTPSLLTREEISALFSKIHEHFSLKKNGEVTLETNPDDITEENLHFWKELGINRLSIGIQSFKEEDLKMMNRAHTMEEALTAVEKAKKAGIHTISIDLIYGLPDLSLDDWKNHVLKAISLGVNHISAYCLTVEKGTLLHHQVEKGKVVPAGEDQQSEQFLILVDTLAQHGFEQYEISNFAKNNAYAEHNTSYWLGKPYLGIGPSAHSYDGTERRWNVANNIVYMKSVGLNNNWFESEQLSTRDRWNELLLTGLRTKFGVNLDHLTAIAPISQDFIARLSAFEKGALLKIEDNCILLTKEGKLKADFIASELFL